MYSILNLYVIVHLRLCIPFLCIEEKCRNDVLKRQCHTGKLHVLRREYLYEDMLQLFSSEEAAMEYPFQVTFQGERGVDTGGLSREAFSTFGSLHIKIISMGVQACGFLPVRIAFPTMAAMLLHPLLDFPPDFLVEAFRDSLTPVDAVAIKEALACRERENFPQRLFNQLINVFASFECLEVPKPCNILKLCERSARYLCLTKPFAAVTEIGKGVPCQHHVYTPP